MIRKALAVFVPLLVVLKSASASEFEFAARLTSGNSDYTQSVVWTGSFVAPNGKLFDVSHLYKSERQTFNLSGYFLFGKSRSKTIFLIPFKYDNGFSAPLYSAKKRLDIGVILNRRINTRVSMNFGVFDLYSLGGKITENPCLDMFNREFHCGSGLPWVDYRPQAHVKTTTPRFLTRLTYSF